MKVKEIKIDNGTTVYYNFLTGLGFSEIFREAINKNDGILAEKDAEWAKGVYLMSGRNYALMLTHRELEKWMPKEELRNAVLIGGVLKFKNGKKRKPFCSVYIVDDVGVLAKYKVKWELDGKYVSDYQMSSYKPAEVNLAWESTRRKRDV